MEREMARSREAEASTADIYEVSRAIVARSNERASKGRVVVKGKELPWEQNRMGRVKWYLHELAISDTAISGWRCFIHDVRTHSGKHRHQGGLVIFVLEGKGWTVVDGVRTDWEEGDLLLLPIRPNGVEHQHFNSEPGKSCKWLAMIYAPYREAMASQLEQKELSPDWKGGA